MLASARMQITALGPAVIFFVKPGTYRQSPYRRERIICSWSEKPREGARLSRIMSLSHELLDKLPPQGTSLLYGMQTWPGVDRRSCTIWRLIYSVKSPSRFRMHPLFTHLNSSEVISLLIQVRHIQCGHQLTLVTQVGEAYDQAPWPLLTDGCA